MRVEQAIFTSIRGERLDGYQLAARSPGIDETLARRLTTWGPAHDSLLDPGPAASSINFHALHADRFALSKTTRQGAEYSGRGGGRIVTQFFVIDTEIFARFANHPLAILRALVAAGRTRIVELPPKTLGSFPLVGRAAGPDAHDLAEAYDPDCLDKLAGLIRKQESVAVVVDPPAEGWLIALYARLNLPERLQLSFTTGLKPTACRPFLLSVLADDPAAIRQSQRGGGLTVVHLTRHAAVV